MINLSIRLSNPFSDRWGCIVTKSFLFGKKGLELNAYKTNTIVNADLRVSTRCDHAGLHLMLGLLGYEAELHYYDTRHWDYEKNRWNVCE